MKCYLFILIVVCPVVMNACSNSDSKKIQKNQPKEEALQTDSQIEMPSKAKEEKVEMSSLSPMEADDVPFQYPCDFEFFDMGIIRVSNSRWEEIQCGKGWDSGKGSCTFVYGEHIYNNFFTDSIITEYRTHLVDLDSSQIEMTPAFLQSKLFKSHVIATTINGIGIFKTIWDPYKTGKYPKPRQWVGD